MGCALSSFLFLLQHSLGTYKLFLILYLQVLAFWTEGNYEHHTINSIGT